MDLENLCRNVILEYIQIFKDLYYYYYYYYASEGPG